MTVVLGLGLRPKEPFLGRRGPVSRKVRKRCVQCLCLIGHFKNMAKAPVSRYDLPLGTFSILLV